MPRYTFSYTIVEEGSTTIEASSYADAEDMFYTEDFEHNADRNDITDSELVAIDGQEPTKNADYKKFLENGK